MVGAGKAEGSMDAGNMLKPALARENCVLVQRRWMNTDSTSKKTRRSSVVSSVCWSMSPTRKTRLRFLRPKERYEVHHSVAITDSAIIATAQLSQRYITDRQLPDKAIDLIDEAASNIRMEIDSKPESMDKLSALFS